MISNSLEIDYGVWWQGMVENLVLDKILDCVMIRNECGGIYASTCFV